MMNSKRKSYLSEGPSSLTNSSVVGNARIIDLTVNDLQVIISNEISKNKEKLEVKPETDYITRQEACDILHLTLPTLHKLMNEGKITYFKASRRTLISKKSVFAYINKPVI